MRFSFGITLIDVYSTSISGKTLFLLDELSSSPKFSGLEGGGGVCAENRGPKIEKRFSTVCINEMGVLFFIDSDTTLGLRRSIFSSHKHAVYLDGVS